MKKLVLFPERDFSFDPSVDIQEVDQFGFVDLNEVLTKGIIPSFVSDVEQEFNGVMNPGTLLPRAADVFDGIRKSEYVSRTLASMSEQERKLAEAAAKQEPAANVTE